MNIPVTAPLMTAEEFLALDKDDGVERWLIDGRLYEKRGEHVTQRNRWHSRIEARITQLLSNWVDRQPEPRGAVYCGEVGFILRRNPDVAVGIDVAYIAPELAAREPQDTTLIDGVPVLAVEILSPSDTEEEINQKVDEYLRVGVPLVWLVDPHFRTVRVHRPGAEPEL